MGGRENLTEPNIRALEETISSPTAKEMKSSLGAKNKSSVQWNIYRTKIIEKCAPGVQAFPWKHVMHRELSYPGQ